MRLAALLSIVTVVIGQAYQLRSVVVDGGGQRLAAPPYQAGMSVAQSAASGWLASAGYRAVIGFWHGPYAPIGVGEAAEARVRVEAPVLEPCVPSPVSRRAVIRCALPQAATVELAVFGADGRRAATLLSGRRAAGWYRVTWDVGGVDRGVLPNGVYVLRLEAGSTRLVQKVVLAR